MMRTELDVGVGAYGVAIDGVGAVWCSVIGSGGLVRVDHDGSVDRLRLGEDSRPTVLTTGPDGAVWFSRAGAIGRIEADRSITTLDVPGEGDPYGLCVATDGSVWVTVPSEDRISRLRPGQPPTEVAAPPGSMPGLLTQAADGTVWVTLNQANALGALGREAPGGEAPGGEALGLVRLPTEAAAPVGICASGDGLWFAEIGAGRLGHLADGVVEEHPLPDPASRPHAVAATSDGGCWASLWAASAAVRVDRRGRIVDEVTFPEGAEPHGIAVAADGCVWVALESGRLVRHCR